jgi:hypothetical protein
VARRPWFSIRFWKNNYARENLVRRGSGNGGEFSADALTDSSDGPNFKMDLEAYVNHFAEGKKLRCVFQS